MENKVRYGQFYTKRSHYIIGNLLGDLPTEVPVVEPFCGEGDLLLFENQVELYDIDPKIDGCIKRDTLLNPPDYCGKFVVTNPPFLGRNKNLDKDSYEKYGVSDLYKAAIKSILNSNGGILIVPLNFLSDEDSSLRELFFNNFDITKLNIFEETVFDDTAYTVCSFYFCRKSNEKIYTECTFFPSGEKKILEFNRKTGYRIGGDFLEIIHSVNNVKISRLLEGGIPNSNIFLRAIDTGSLDGRISLSIKENYFYGKKSDRVFATLVLDKEYSKKEQEIICSKFNEIMEFYRKKYNSLFLTAYRNSSKEYSRKRISFETAYKLTGYIIKNYINHS